MSHFFQHNTRHRARQHALELRVRSPRLVWLGVLRQLVRVVKVLVVLALLGAACWGGAYGLRRFFIENDDFRLQVIELTPNEVIDPAGVAELGQIDLTGSLFKVDIAALQERLAARPDVESARVERKLPDTLVVDLRVRKPVAWLEWRDHGLAGREAAGMLLDADGYLFPCSAMQWEHAGVLPVIEMTGPASEAPSPGQRVLDPAVRRALKLVSIAAAKLAEAEAGWQVERVRPVNGWSFELVTSDGEQATFGLSELPRQMDDLLTIKRHIASQGGRIGSINLIPERNIPVVLAAEPATQHNQAPRAIVVPEPNNPPAPAAPRSNKLDRDVRAILNRN